MPELPETTLSATTAATTAENTVSPLDRAVERSLRGRRDIAADEVGRLIEACLALIRRTGELEPRVSEIVREAGLHNQAFYRHFRSKHELLVAVLDQGIGLLASYLAHRMDSAATPAGRVRAWLSGILEQAIAARGAEATRPFVLARGRLAESYPNEVRESERRLTALVRAAIATGVATGDFPNADPEQDAEMLYVLAMGWVEHRLPASPQDADPQRARDAAHALESFALAGLARS